MDALGSVRATLDDAGMPQATASDDAWGVPESPAIAPFGFTGALQQDSDVWLRARWYGAGRGVFSARDAFMGRVERPASLNPYVYVENNPITFTDPTGREKYRIWAAAFIKPSPFEFYYPKDYLGVGTWHGDGRGFTDGSYNRYNPQSRVWYDVEVDVTASGGKITSHDEDTGETQVRYRLMEFHGIQPVIVTKVDKGKAPKPQPPRIDTSQPCKVRILIDVDGKPGQNPLMPLAPSLRYHYIITFDMALKRVSVEGARSAFPWHELAILKDNHGVFQGDAPSQETPARLILPDRHMTPWSIPLENI